MDPAIPAGIGVPTIFVWWPLMRSSQRSWPEDETSILGSAQSSSQPLIVCSIISGGRCGAWLGISRDGHTKIRAYANNSRRASSTADGGRERAAHKDSDPNPTEGFLCSFEGSPAGSLFQFDIGAGQMQGYQHPSVGGWAWTL
jgi:hypothetical protein